MTKVGASGFAQHDKVGAELNRKSPLVSGGSLPFSRGLSARCPVRYGVVSTMVRHRRASAQWGGVTTVNCHSERSAAESRNLSGGAPQSTRTLPERCFDCASGLPPSASLNMTRWGGLGSAQHDKVGGPRNGAVSQPSIVIPSGAQRSRGISQVAHPNLHERSPRGCCALKRGRLRASAFGFAQHDKVGASAQWGGVTTVNCHSERSAAESRDLSGGTPVECDTRLTTARQSAIYTVPWEGHSDGEALLRVHHY